MLSLVFFVSDVQISTFDWAELEKVRDLGKPAADDIQTVHSRPRSPVGNMSDCRYMSVSRSRGCEFDPAWPVPILLWRLILK